MTDQEIRLHFGEMNASEMRLARAIVGWHEAEQAKLRAGMTEAFKVIDVLYMDALDSHKESWPRAREWMEQWAQFKPSNQATKPA